MTVIQACYDTKDVLDLFRPQGLYLKPISRLNVSVQLPQLKLTVQVLLAVLRLGVCQRLKLPTAAARTASGPAAAPVGKKESCRKIAWKALVNLCDYSVFSFIKLGLHTWDLIVI